MIVDTDGKPIAVSSEEDESLSAPTWATDPDEPLPLAYERISDADDKFVLGMPGGKRAAALVERAAWRARPELLVELAAGAWKALVGEHCDREMAELIAKGWTMLFGRCVN
jgi:hypothetical protein